jgi:hypothetical protein
MTAKQVRVRRDTLSNLNAVIPADGEIAYNTTDDRAHMGDGTTYGGIPHPNYKDIQKSYFDYAADSGSANAVAIALPYAPASYSVGIRVKFKANATNTGATTINVNSLGTKNLQKYTAGALGGLVAGDIVAGGMYEAIYDGTQFQLLTYQKGGITAVSQGDINTSTGTFSATISGTAAYVQKSSYVLMPGGSYGFGENTRNGANGAYGFISGYDGGSYAAYSALIGYKPSSGADPTMQAQQRYITSSPPFDLLDQGEAGGFIFGLVDSSGKLISHYAADVPPWGYNGPTDIRACRECPSTGKKFRRVMKKRSLEEIMDGAKMIFEEQEITQAIKNADMNLIPHPFSGIPAGSSVVLLNPFDDRIRDLIDYQNAGGADEVVDALMKGKIYFDNDLMDLKAPPGVGIHKMKFKYSGRKG